MKNSFLSPIVKVIILITLVSLALIITACGKSAPKTDKYSFYETVIDTTKPIAWGEDRDIYVLCDEANWTDIQDSLKSSLEREVAVVVKERYFNLIRKDLKDIDQLTKYKNLLFMGDLESKTPVSEHIKATMPPRLVDRVKNTGADIFVAKNRWVTDQIVIYMVGSNRENLLNLNIVQKDRLFTEFLNRLGERLAYQAYLTKVIPEDFYKPYPYTLKLPTNYRLYVNDEKNHFLSFLCRIGSESRDFPDKYISVYYEDIKTDSLALDWALNKRKGFAAKYYDKDEFDPKLLHSKKIAFAGYTAWQIIGPWKNMKHDIGGGFQTFAIFDAKQKRAYLIDNVVYYPAGDKLPVLLELEKLSATFRIK